MGPEGMAQYGAFSKELPPAFNGHTSYSVYRQDVELWLLLTTFHATKQGPALIGRLDGEAKASAKPLVLLLLELKMEQ